MTFKQAKSCWNTTFMVVVLSSMMFIISSIIPVVFLRNLPKNKDVILVIYSVTVPLVCLICLIGWVYLSLILDRIKNKPIANLPELCLSQLDSEGDDSYKIRIVCLLGGTYLVTYESKLCRLRLDQNLSQQAGEILDKVPHANGFSYSCLIKKSEIPGIVGAVTYWDIIPTKN